MDRFLIFRSCFGWGEEFFHLDVQQYTTYLGVFLGHILQKFGQVKKIEIEFSVTNSFLFLEIRQIFKKKKFGEIFVTFQHLPIQIWGSLSPAYLEFSQFSHKFTQNLWDDH